MKLIGAISLILSLNCYAVELPVKSSSALVIDADTGEVLFEKNSTTVAPIASITKLMTSVVTLDAELDMNERIEITYDDVQATMLRGKPTSSSLRPGMVLSREELLRLTLMNSQNRAAAALARTYPGGHEEFIRAMNLKALTLGMSDTHYTDPTGLHSSNKSTAKDLATLVRYAQDQYPQISEFSASPRYTISAYSPVPRSFGTTNRLVVSKGWDILLQKTGYIRDAGRCVTMVVQTAYKRVVIVLLNAKSTQERARDAVTIKYWLDNDSVPSTAAINKLNPYAKKSFKKRKKRA